MKITVSSTALWKIARKVHKATKAKQLLCQIDAHEETFTITGTNGEKTASEKIWIAECEGSCSFTVRAREFIQELDIAERPVTIDIDLDSDPKIIHFWRPVYIRVE